MKKLTFADYLFFLEFHNIKDIIEELVFNIYNTTLVNHFNKTKVENLFSDIMLGVSPEFTNINKIFQQNLKLLNT